MVLDIAWDHPRSRGVYPQRNVSATCENGSSPLARGLHKDTVECINGYRIIPARAGFTGGLMRAGGRAADHPRSRGVYWDILAKGQFDGGSSPLARGLQVPGVAGGRGGGIIPARAGFTRHDGRRRGGLPDHPRSRGVYAQPPRLRAHRSGSSPLARGLRRHRRHAKGRQGIIPARAGFTRRTVTRVTHTWDHPRSRGVYTATLDDLTWTPGSSPLARGLRSPLLPVIGGPGIIPARAGFTSRTTPASTPSSDHPRSRGVYRNRAWTSSRRSGSSPLARGLPSPGPLPEGRSMDHPRSRGVYNWDPAPVVCENGSSPLARGLHDLKAEEPIWAGIIPARAGFTHDPRHHHCYDSDHPRSRGVYGRGLSPGVIVVGSSPLARGLPSAPDVQGERVRIIPARAGFTSKDANQMRGSGDHPRSRGVYSISHPLSPAGQGSSPLARGLPSG